jgi:hypothetical protein
MLKQCKEMIPMRYGFRCFEAGLVVAGYSGYCAAFVFISFVEDCFYYPFCLILLGVGQSVKCCFIKLLYTEIPLLQLPKNNTFYRPWTTSKNRRQNGY